ncbi:hypothetical protein [Pasteuria penetrans]|uniref:hypothetical protein n=1 Tax=Pasteuria penetrans TaxID=86005 RepID=UPI0011F03C38|nr:hypothetical protein [Pasteuria penetrans]
MGNLKKKICNGLWSKKNDSPQEYCERRMQEKYSTDEDMQKKFKEAFASEDGKHEYNKFRKTQKPMPRRIIEAIPNTAKSSAGAILGGTLGGTLGGVARSFMSK